MSAAGSHRRITAAVFAALALLTWFAYWPAFSGAFALDDTANLSGLAGIGDNLAALRFVFTGEAGPLGRPLALASFLPQADSFADGPRSFLQVNVLIHILNGGLLTWMLLLLGRHLGLSKPDLRLTTLGASSVWLFMPLLATSSLMVVQRMTSLSATFVLLGVIGWLLARARMAQNPLRVQGTMLLVLGVATPAAVLSKENGALLPVYLLVLESTLLTAPAAIDPRRWRLLKSIALGLPTAVLVGYLLSRINYAEATELRMDMSGWQRLATEAEILWAYLIKAFLPVPGSITPFNDTQSVVRSLFEPLALLAVLSWTFLIGFAIRHRRRHALAAFAILWYLGGHLLESTTIPLELYFDHRNYLPIIGPVFAAVMAAVSVSGKIPLLRTLIPLYALLLCGVLVLLTSLWGQPPQAAAYWYQKQPTSVRAASTLVSRQLEHEGVGPALETMQEFVNANPQHAYLLIQDLNISCQLDPASDHSAKVASLSRLLKDVDFTYTAGTMLSELINVAAKTGCNGVGPGAQRLLIDALYANPRYAAVPLYSSLHHELRALSYRIENNFDSALSELSRADAIGADRDIVIRRIVVLAQAGRTGEARQLLQAATERNDWHPVRQWLRQRDLNELGSYIAAVEASSEATSVEEQGP